MYKAKIDKMIEDSKENFEFKVFKECKTVRENLLDKYNKLNKEHKPEVEIFANLYI